MKKLQFVFVIGLTFILFSCKKENGGSNEIYGNWKLNETMYDPGDGSGKYIKVKEAKFATFDREGNIKGNAITDLVGYKILDSVRMEVRSNNHSTPLIYRYKLKSSRLELNPPCIEGCGLRFIRVR